MRPYKEWTEASLLQIIKEGTKERDDLEYKGCGALRPTKRKPPDEVAVELGKDVSAMANAAGGLIIYGILEENLAPTELDVGFDPSLPKESPEWLENVILGNLHPSPPDLLVCPIALTDARAGRVAYLVSVGRAPRGCQASDGRYYRRRNFRNEILSDWEVRELLNRSVRPQVAIELKNVTLSHGDSHGSHHKYLLVVEVQNRGLVRVANWKVILDFAKEFSGAILPGAREILIEHPPGTRFPALRHVVTNTGKSPLFPDETELVLQLRWHVDDALYELAERERIAVRWELYADDISPVRDVRLIRELHNF